MKKTQKLLTLVMSVVLAFCLVLGLVACSVPRDVGGEYITPRSEEHTSELSHS